jgi:hypothetical protein
MAIGSYGNADANDRSLHNPLPPAFLANLAESFLAGYVEHLKAHVPEPDGRVIIGAYGSRSKNSPAFDVDKFLRKKGIAVAGGVTVGIENHSFLRKHTLNALPT